ncbi:hypothetical protein Tco_0846213 [Tanacetum coccineum]
MSTLKFADTHNMVAFLSKPTESDGFEKIVNFLNANPIKYALTINPIIYTSCIEQFWATVKVKTVNGEVQLQALVDGKKVIITESTIIRDLHLEDAEGVDCLPNATIFEQLTLMGAKTTAWNEFSSTMASAIICLATNQKFNFSKYIFESMVKNLESVGNFLMYPRLDCLCKKIGSSDEVVWADQEDASKRKRKLMDIDMMQEITLVDETQGKYGDDLMFDTVSTADPVTTAGEVVTTASVEVSTVSPTETTIADELTLAQTLIEIKSEKPKVKRVVIGEQSKSTTRTRPQQLPSKDKGKGIMEEPEKPTKRKDQIRHDEEVAQRLQAQMQAELEEEDRLVRQREEEVNIVSWDIVQAMIDADYQMAQQMQAEEQYKLSVEEKSKLFV